MAFKQSAYILKNTEELRNLLIKLGYKPFGTMKGKYISTDALSGEFETCDDEGLENIRKNPFGENPEPIDCRTNEALFLSLAAMRDDTDRFQWFISEESFSLVNQGIYSPEGSFSYCLIDKFYGKGHKATVQEIIKEYG